MTLGLLRLAIDLAVSDIRLQYRRTTLGPLWVTLTVFGQVLIIGLIFSGLFRTDVLDYMIFLSSGLVLWTFLISAVNEGATSLTVAGPLIKQVALHPSLHVFRVVIKNTLIFLHNSIVLVPLLAMSADSISWAQLMAVPGAVLLVANILWVSMLTSVVGARYRDLPSIVSSFLTLAFYVTPILWMPEQLASFRFASVLELNPLFHWLQLVREPVVGNPYPFVSLAVSTATALIGLTISLIFLKKNSPRIPFWV